MPQCIYCLHNFVEKDGRYTDDEEFVCRHCDPDAQDQDQDDEFGYDDEDFGGDDEDEKRRNRPPRRRTE